MPNSGASVARGAGLALLLLGPLVVVLDRLDAVGDITLFVLAGSALIPISWLIGEATDNLASYTGPGVGGFLNATFGNAPELIIAIVAVADGLTEIVRASLVGSIVGNLLLVLGFTLLFGRTGRIDRMSAYVSLGLVGFAGLLLLVTATPGFHGNPDRRSLAEFSIPFALLLLTVRVVVTRRALRRQRALFSPAEEQDGWPLPTAVAVLAVATLLTAFVTETLVGTLRSFAARAHLSEFFVAVVIVAIIGNATEHGSAVLLARRGRVKLAVEISMASSAQIAGLLIPLVAIASWAFARPLALSFRPVELASICVAAALPALVLRNGRTSRIGGVVLLAAYSILVVVFYLAGDR